MQEMTNHTISDADAKHKLLDAFLVDNEDLETLNARLAAFNLFRVLRIERAEIRHSNVLAWLLTPDETHGLGSTFLRRFLSRLLMENEGIKGALSPAQIELMSFADIEVFREWHNVDILVRSHSDNWCLLIENKIGSKESKGQLSKYKDCVAKETPNLQVIPVYLTLEGDDPSAEGKDVGYVSLSHSQILELVELITRQHAARIPRDASVFLNQYLDTLRRLTMQDEELVDLCKSIYGKHREAVDLIVEYGASSQLLDTAVKELDSLVECEFNYASGARIWFLPKEMGVHLPTVDLVGWPNLKRSVPVLWWFYFGRKVGKVGIAMEVGPVADGGKRRQLMEALRDAGFSFSNSAFKESAKFTRILSQWQMLKQDEAGRADDSPEYIQEVTKKLWLKLWPQGHKVIDVIKTFDWGKG